MDIEIMTLAEALDKFNVLIAIGLFVLYCFVEFLDSSLTFHITKHKSLKAANTTFVLYIIWGIEVFAFISNYLYTIPISMGAWLGSYLLVEREKKKHPLKKTA